MGRAEHPERVELIGQVVNAPVVEWDAGTTIDLRTTSDAEVRALLEVARHQGRTANSGILACPEGAELLLSLFECRRCGQCCEGTIFKEPVLPLTRGERKRIARYVGWSSKRLRHFCTQRNGSVCIRLPCPFYQDHTCSIYDLRPLSCRLYPIQSAIQVRAQDGELLPPTFTLDVDCPGGDELVFKIVKLRKSAFSSGQKELVS